MPAFMPAHIGKAGQRFCTIGHFIEKSRIISDHVGPGRSGHKRIAGHVDGIGLRASAEDFPIVRVSLQNRCDTLFCSRRQMRVGARNEIARCPVPFHAGRETGISAIRQRTAAGRRLRFMAINRAYPSQRACSTPGPVLARAFLRCRFGAGRERYKLFRVDRDAIDADGPVKVRRGGASGGPT